MIGFCRFIQRNQHQGVSNLHKINTLCFSVTNSSRFENKRTLSNAASLPSSAEIVIAGGGVIGSSVAYHLAKFGKKDVLLLEQGRFGGGTTWHSVGLCSALRQSSATTELGLYAQKLYSSIEEETGLTSGFKKCGSLIVARSRDRAIHLRRVADKTRLWGVTSKKVTPQEAKEIWPLIRTDDLEMALHIPNDGVVNASDAQQTLLRGATMKGVTALEGIKVTNVLTKNGQVDAVETDHGIVQCQTFVNCGGQWARDLGLKSSPQVDIPLHSCEHFYVVTKPVEGVYPMIPVLRDQDARVYVREWSGGMMIGGFEDNAKACFYDGVPDDFTFQLLEEDWDQFSVIMDGAIQRIPDIKTAEIRQFVNGPESFAPDDIQMTGKAHSVKNYFVCAGMSSLGITLAPGSGRHIAEMIVYDKTTVHDSGIDVNRFNKDHNNKYFLRDRVEEALGTAYAIPYPQTESYTSRKMKCSALYGTLKASGADFGCRGGWEVAKVFPNDDNYVDRKTFGTPSWLPYVEQEIKHCELNAGLVDLSYMNKFEVTASDEIQLIKALESIFANDINIKNNDVISSAIIDNHGYYHAVADIIRIDSNSVLITVQPEQHTIVKAFLSNCKDIQTRDVSGAYACIGMIGPKSEEILESVAQLNMLNSFPSSSAKVMEVACGSNVVLVKGSFEKTVEDWKLIIPSEYAVGVYEALLKSGKDIGAGPIGQKTLNLYRVRKCLPEFNLDFGRATNVLEFAKPIGVSFDKFQVGKTHENTDSTLKKNISVFRINDSDPSNWPWGSEPLFQNDDLIGSVTSCGYEFDTQSPVVMAYTNIINEKPKNFEVSIAGKRFSLTKIDK